MVYFLFVLDTETYVAEDCNTLITTLVSKGFADINQRAGRPYILVATHSEDNMMRDIYELENGKAILIEAHADEDSGGTRIKYSYMPDLGWDIAGQLPLFPAKQLLEFV